MTMWPNHSIHWSQRRLAVSFPLSRLTSHIRRG
jgi:hypothetical protein